MSRGSARSRSDRGATCVELKGTSTGSVRSTMAEGKGGGAAFDGGLAAEGLGPNKNTPALRFVVLGLINAPPDNLCKNTQNVPSVCIPQLPVRIPRTPGKGHPHCQNNTL